MELVSEEIVAGRCGDPLQSDVVSRGGGSAGGGGADGGGAPAWWWAGARSPKAVPRCAKVGGVRSPGARCRWLLRAYPAWYRRDRGGEMLGTLLEASRPDARWPSFPRRAGLVFGACGSEAELASCCRWRGGTRSWRGIAHSSRSVTVATGQCHLDGAMAWGPQVIIAVLWSHCRYGRCCQVRCCSPGLSSSVAGGAQLAPGSWLGWFVGGGPGAYEPDGGLC